MCNFSRRRTLPASLFDFFSHHADRSWFHSIENNVKSDGGNEPVFCPTSFYPFIHIFINVDTQPEIDFSSIYLSIYLVVYVEVLLFLSILFSSLFC